MKISFIGLGVMGGPMALNLLKAGFDLVVNDIDRDKAAPQIAAGAAWADTPREVAEAVDIVLTSVPGPPQVKAVADGDNGLIAGLSDGIFENRSKLLAGATPGCPEIHQHRPGA